MSRRRKHVRNQLEEACPELGEGDAVCRVVAIRGGNQIEVEKEDGSQTLIRVPSKFSKVLWVRQGSFVSAHFEEDAEEAAKVTGELLRVLYADQIKEMRKVGTWPARFETATGLNAYEREGMEVTGDMMGGLSVNDETLGVAAASGDGDGREGVAGGGASVGDASTSAGLAVGGEGEERGESECSESDDDLPPIEANRNWRPLRVEMSSDEDESSSDEEE